MYVIFVHICCRAPRGARGLKYYGTEKKSSKKCRSRPARGAWIEIAGAHAVPAFGVVAPREGRVD